MLKCENKEIMLCKIYVIFKCDALSCFKKLCDLKNTFSNTKLKEASFKKVFNLINNKKECWYLLMKRDYLMSPNYNAWNIYILL